MSGLGVHKPLPIRPCGEQPIPKVNIRGSGARCSSNVATGARSVCEAGHELIHANLERVVIGARLRETMAQEGLAV